MKTKILTVCINVLIVTGLYSQWISNGPYGGPAHDVIKLNSNYYIATDNGVFLSSDQGQNWSSAGTALQGRSVASLEVCDSILFAGVNYNGVYRSADSGSTWVKVSNGIADVSFNFLFCSSAGLFNSTPDGTYFSADGGDNWTLANNGIPSTYIIYSYAESNGAVFGGTYGSGLYKTTDDGANWTSVGGGFPSGTFVYALLASGNTIFAGTSAGVYKSLNGGLTWVSSNNGFPANMWANNFAMSGTAIYAGTYSEGIFKSTNNGASWTPVNNGIPDLPFNNGLPHNYPYVRGLYAENGTVIATTFDGIYRTVNQAVTWSEANNGIRATDLSWIAANSTTIFSGSEFTGLYTSPDKGITWVRSNTGLSSYWIISIDASDDAVFLSAQNEKAFVSTSNGSTWTNASTGLQSNPKMFQHDSSRVLTITQGAQYVSQGLFETTNNGANWTQIPTNFQVYPTFNSLAFRGSDIYIASDSGRIFYTSNNGVNWTDIGSGLPDVYVNSLFLDASTLYAGTEAGLFKTMDNGTTWSPMNNGIPADTVNDVIVVSGIVYASLPGNGIYVSNNAGASWVATNSGLDNLNVVKLAGDGAVVYAATRNGVYSMTVPTGSGKVQHPIEASVFPNPGNGSFYLSVPGQEKVSVQVYSLAGQLILSLKEYTGGLISLNAEDRAAGIYLLKIQGDDFSIMKKLVIEN